MKWNIISGSEENFTGAPEWALKKVIIDGDMMWWDGVSRFEPIPAHVVTCLFEYEEEFKLIAERAWDD
ncbi:hypothetical protein [Yersinia enterocolitica]|uniref:hypothetical protein n=1 Tax=Yersinia enterocolitica TaxID=630 RepID=UPI000977831C|nr:hypothetical protein [Yersinia enterocolitica]